MNFKKGLIISFGTHIIVIVLMTVRFVFFTPKIIDLSQAVRVDMVAFPVKVDDNALPEKVQDILKENPEPEAKSKELPAKKEFEPDPNVVDLKKSKQKQKNAFDKLKKLSAIDKIKQDLKNETEKKSDLKTAPIRGRVLSAGTKIAGLDKIQSDDYLSQLDAQIKANWSIPQWMIGKPFKASVWVKVNPDGTVASKKIVRSSGNATYDDYCLAAVDKASPFPPVPSKFSEVFKIDGVSFAFPD